MAEGTKHQAINGGTLISDFKNMFSLIRTKRTVTFLYGFMFAFVFFTIFMAFKPSSNTYSLSFTNIFTLNTNNTSLSPDSSSRSHFSSIFSYFFPNTSSSHEQRVHIFPFSPPPSTNFSRSNTTKFHSPTFDKQPPSSKNHTQKIASSDKPKNFTKNPEISDKPKVLLPNQTTISPTKGKVAENGRGNSPEKSNSSGKSNSGKEEKIVPQKGVIVNNSSSSKSKKESNRTSSVDDDLMKCNLFDGKWVRDDSYPLYKPGSCSLIDEQFNCILNGRPDHDYQKLKWKPNGCTLPRLDGSRMLDLLRGKRLVFVGDSLNRNMWESLVCILRNSVKDRSRVFEAHGRHHFRGEASYSFIFKDYSCSVEFFVSPFLVQEWEIHDKSGLKKETLRLDLLGKSSNRYKDADIIVFNTGHWWTHEKTSTGKNYYQEGSHVYGELNVLEAFRKALTTWARWIDANINPTNSMVFFRGYSASHFSGGQWNSGGQCDSENEPIKNTRYLRPYPPKMNVLEKILRNMKTRVTYLNITRMSDFRKDGHPSIYRKHSISAVERKLPLRFEDCSHWCLPGVPDAWNEVFYAELIIRLNQKQQQQKKT